MQTDNPFVGPRPLTSENRIFGRDHEIADLFHLVMAERIVLLHSPSGAGKSSLINAGLIPELVGRFDLWSATRVNLEPPPGITPLNRYAWSAMMGLEEGVPKSERRSPETLASMTLKDYALSRPCPADASPNKFLIIDQFEEIIRTASEDVPAQSAFFLQLSELLALPNLWVLFSVREDYLAPLLPLAAMLPTHLRARYRLDFLNTNQAKLVMTETAALGGRTVHPDVVNALIENLAAARFQTKTSAAVVQSLEANYIEPMHLQVVCRRLWEELPPSDRSVDPEDVAVFGDVSRFLGEYYDSVVLDIAGDDTLRQRAIREWFHDKLIRDDIRSQIQMGPASTEGLPNRDITKLLQAHLVRTEKRRGVTWVELAHDRLIEPVQLANDQWFLSNINDAQRAAALWVRQDRNKGLLLSGAALEQAKAWHAANPELATQAEKDFIEISIENEAAIAREAAQNEKLRRRFWMAMATLAMAIVCALVALNAQQKAATEQEKAERSSLHARLALASASYRAAEARSALGREGHALAYLAHALTIERDIESTPIRARIAGLLLYNDWWLPVRRLSHPSPSAAFFASDDLSRTLVIRKDGTIQRWEISESGNASELESHSLESSKPFDGAEVSSDGQYILTYTKSGSATVWRAESGKPIGHPINAGHGITAAVIARDNKSLLLSSGHEVTLWQIDGSPIGDKVSRVSDQKSPPLSFGYSVSGSRFFVTTSLTRVEVFSSADGTRVDALTLDCASPGNSTTRIGWPSLTPDGSRIFAFCYDTAAPSDSRKSALRMKKADWPEPKSLPLELSLSGRLSFSPKPGALQVAVIAEKSTVILWSPDEPEAHNKLTLHLQAAPVVFAFDKTGSRLATASDDQVVQVWDTVTGRKITRDLPHDDSLQSVRFDDERETSQKQYLLTVTANGAVQLWDLSDGSREGAPFEGGERSLFARSAAGRAAIITRGATDSYTNWRIRIVNENLRGRDPLKGQWDLVDFTMDGSTVISGSTRQRRVQLWDASSAMPVGRPIMHSSELKNSAVSPNAQFIATNGKDGSVFVWSVDERKPLYSRQVLEPKKYKHLTTGFTPDSRAVVVAYFNEREGRIEILTAPVNSSGTGSARIVHLNPSPAYDPELKLTFSPDKRKLSTLSQKRVLQVWDAGTGKPIGGTRTQDLGVEGLPAVSPDRSRVITAPDQQSLEFHSLSGNGESAEWQTTRISLGVNLTGAQLSPSGTHIVTFHPNGIAQIWSAKDGRKIGLPLRHRDCVIRRAAFSHDTARLLTSCLPVSGPDRTAANPPPPSDANEPALVRFWDLRTGSTIGDPISYPSAVRRLEFSADLRTALVRTGDEIRILPQVIDSGTSADIDLLLKFAQAVGGHEVDGRGAVVPVADQLQLLRDLHQEVEKHIDACSQGKLPWQIRQFLANSGFDSSILPFRNLKCPLQIAK